MRPNYTHIASCPSTRNDFINSITEQDAVIVVNHTLLQELTKEINSNIQAKKQGNFFKKASVPMAILSWSNPVGWVLSGIVLLSGILHSAGDEFKKYKIYAGIDTSHNQILVFHNKHKVDLKYDTLSYPSFVQNIDYKKTNKKVSTSK